MSNKIEKSLLRAAEGLGPEKPGNLYVLSEKRERC